MADPNDLILDIVRLIEELTVPVVHIVEIVKAGALQGNLIRPSVGIRLIAADKVKENLCIWHEFLLGKMKGFLLSQHIVLFLQNRTDQLMAVLDDVLFRSADPDFE